MTTTLSQSEICGGILADFDAAYTRGDVSQAARDALDDAKTAIADVLGAAQQAQRDLAELEGSRDLLPAHGFDRLHRETQTAAQTSAESASRRFDQAVVTLREALTDDALPTFNSTRESLARQELALALGESSGQGAYQRIHSVIDNGSPEAVAVLLRSGFGRTLLQTRGGFQGRELDEALGAFRTIAAGRAIEKGETPRERSAGAALAKLKLLGAARTSAMLSLDHALKGEHVGV